jgi:predicted nucleotidyltransferase
MGGIIFLRLHMYLKEERQKYGITQKEFSEITKIPLRTIENWESNKRNPPTWIKEIIISYLEHLPRNQFGFITENFGKYTIEDIKHIITNISKKDANIHKVILFGSYASGNESYLSDIDLIIDTDLKGLDFFELKYKIQSAFVKPVDIIRYDALNDQSMIQMLDQASTIYEAS